MFTKRLGSSWSLLEPSWSVLGASWSVLERLERVFDRLGRVYVTLPAGDAALAGLGEAQLSRRRKPYEGNLTQKNYLQRVSV